MILLACATAAELPSGFDRPGVETLITGVGVVESASAITAALGQKRYAAVVGVGIAGAFDGAAAVGEGVALIDDRFVLGREDGSPLHLAPGCAVVDRIASDPALVERATSAGLRALRGITVSRVTTSDTTALRYAATGAQIETMEGFAVLRAAQRAGIPAIGLRGISNRAGDRAQAGWNFAAGVAGLETALRAFFDRVTVPDAPA